MNNNPFISKTYQDIWLHHFRNNVPIFKFNFIPHIKFYKAKRLPIYINSGKNYTNGIAYSIVDEKDYKGKVFLIYDVANTVKIENEALQDNRLRTIKIRQYKGCRLELDEYASFEDYFSTKFNAKFRKNYRQRIKRLEREYDTKYVQYFGSIDKKEYDKIMIRFKELLTKRFSQLKEYNNIIDDWEFYEDIVYPLVLEKRAVLNTIFLNNELAAISLKFISKDSVIGAVKTFDIKYNKHNLGNIELMKIMEWAKINNFSYFDFSKGVQLYKNKFISEIYNFENHILYDSKSIFSSLMALCLSSYFKLKQFLRDKKVNDLYARILFKLKQSSK